MDRLIEWLGGDDTVSRHLLIAALVAARVMPLLLFSPWLATRSAPTLLRTAVGLVLTVSFVPLALAHATLVPTAAFFALAMLREAVVGFTYSVAAALPFFAFDWSGRLVDTWRGAGLAEVLAPSTGERTSPLGNMLLMFSVAVFLAIGGHRVALSTFADGFVSQPIGGFLHAHEVQNMSWMALRLVANALAFTVALAAPAAVAMLAVEMGLGLVARTTPNVPVFFAGMPLRAAMGLVAVLVTLSLLMREMPHAFRVAIAGAKQLVLQLGN